MDIFLNPSTYVALGTLIILEIVLGIDNLVFIAILSGKLPPEQRNKARVIGLSLALLLRFALLSVMSYIAGLKEPVLFLGSFSFSARDVIMLLGGFFLLFKATTELHERLDTNDQNLGTVKEYASFWIVTSQIIALDAIFSLDAVITAVGMANHLSIMMIAVAIAMALMLLASKPLTEFINGHPTIVVLCLSFLLLIGLSLLSEGFGLHIPKEYLYVAIGFSILIEFFNQIAQYNEKKSEKRKPFRVRTAQAVLRLLGNDGLISISPNPIEPNNMGEAHEAPLYADEEVNIVSRVLTLSERTARSIMTHRSDADYIDLDDTTQEQKEQIINGTPSILPVCRGGLDNVVGVAPSINLLADLTQYGIIKEDSLEEPHIVPETMRVIHLLQAMRENNTHFVLVADEYGTIEGIITAMDVFEAIAGDIHEEGEVPDIRELPEGGWLVSGTVDVHVLENTLDIPDLISENNDYTSLAGFLLTKFDKLPETGEMLEHEGYLFTVDEVTERRIAFVKITKSL